MDKKSSLTQMKPLVNATPKCPIFDIRKCHSTLKILISENVNLDSRGKEINPQVISFL